MEDDKNLMQPLVSILMTAYNRESYIREAIESVLNNSYTNWELIITDDCSSDRTLEIAKEYESIDSRITVYKNEKNLGDYPNRNRAASYANGEFLMSVDSDDKLLPTSVEKCIQLFRQFPVADFGIYSPNHSKQVLYDAPFTIQSHFFKKPLLLMGPGGSVIKTSFFKSLGGFPTKYGPANDGYYNLMAASKTHTILIPFELIYYRRHDGQEINNKYSYLYNAYLYLKDALNELELPLNKEQKLYLENKNKRRFLVNTIKFLVRSKDWNKTQQALIKSKFSFEDAFTAIFHKDYL